jgi:hypothetical protein
MSWQARLGELTRLVPPPATPFRAPVDWAKFESENAFLPPADYRTLLNLYGAGTLEAPLGRLSLLQPLHPNRSFLEGNRWMRDSLRGLQRRFPTLEPPWPVYPEPGGFLPFAADDTSWAFGWLTGGAQDDWTTAIDGGRDGWWVQLPFGVVELAARWAEGDLGIPEVQRAVPGGRFLAATADEHWTPVTESARVVFGASLGSASLPTRPSDWVKARVAPAKLQSFGASGDANTPVHAELSVGYRPDDEALVIAAIRALAAELGTRVVGAYALDESPIWEELTGI